MLQDAERAGLHVCEGRVAHDQCTDFLSRVSHMGNNAKKARQHRGWANSQSRVHLQNDFGDKDADDGIAEVLESVT